MAYFLTIAHQPTIADSIHPEIMAAVKHAWTDAQSNDDDYNDDYNIGTKAELVRFFVVIFDSFFEIQKCIIHLVKNQWHLNFITS